MSDDLPLLGFGLPVSGSWATPVTMIDIARRAEELGFASLWTFQRVLSPVDPVGPEGEIGNPGVRPPDDPAYRTVHDPLLPLAYVAAHTERIGLGTATICAPFIAPALLAKQLATLDHLTGGRLTVGLGIGWLRQEYRAAGVPFDRRGARMEEYLRCLHALWADDPVEFSGEFYHVPRSYLAPKPSQRPHPPILLGGAAGPALRRAGRLAQGWISSTRHDHADIVESVGAVRAAARDAGHDPDALRILARVVPEGTRDAVLDEVRQLRAVGVTEVVVDLNFSSHAGSPDADPQRAITEAGRLLDVFAEASRRRPSGGSPP